MHAQVLRRSCTIRTSFFHLQLHSATEDVVNLSCKLKTFNLIVNACVHITHGTNHQILYYFGAVSPNLMLAKVFCYMVSLPYTNFQIVVMCMFAAVSGL